VDNGLFNNLFVAPLVKGKCGENVPVPVVGVLDLFGRVSSLLISTDKGSNLGTGRICAGC
jgi:hypothetical protein